MYPDRAYSVLLYDCSVQWLVKGQHKGCSSAPFSPLPCRWQGWADEALHLSWAVGQKHTTQGSSAMTQADEWEPWLQNAAGCFLPDWLILLTVIWSRVSCMPTSSPAFPVFSYWSSNQYKKKKEEKKILWGREMDKCKFPFPFHKSKGNPLDLTQKV